MLFQPLSAAVESIAVQRQKIQQLDVRYQKLTYEIYSAQTKSLKQEKLDIKEIYNQLQQLIQQKQHYSVILLTHRYFNTIKEHLDNPLIFELIKLLLKYNEYQTANRFYQQVKNNGDQFFIANIELSFAKYHSDRQEWQQSLSFVDTDVENLSTEDTNLIYMLQAMALQSMKKHRNAIKIYQQVTTNSVYYPAAQLNIAIAYIRQDWWTDAHLIIQQLLKRGTSFNQQNESTNRLYLILGYSLLGKEYFRESRESFRNININSQYANKALMGIALTAFNQNDYNGTLNALSQLKEKKPYELVVEESHLLQPYVYKKIAQHMTANAGYTNAIAYYQSRIKQLNHQLKTVKNYHITEIAFNSQSKFVIADSELKFTEHYPNYFLNNLTELNYLKSQVKSAGLTQKINQLLVDYDNTFNQTIETLLSQRVEALNSYLSQSQYGVAELYDNNQ